MSLTSALSFGFRVRAIPFGFFGERTVTTTNSSTDLDYSYQTTSSSPYMGIGPAIEYLLRQNLVLGVDFLHHSAQYARTVGVTNSDDETDTTVETTRMTYWDIPLHVQWLGPPRLPRRMFVSIGGVYRHVGHIRTGNETTYSDGTTDYNETPVKSVRTNLFGASAGLGFRFVDQFGIKVTPEVRYTRWFGNTFSAISTRSEPGQLEAIIGLTF